MEFLCVTGRRFRVLHKMFSNKLAVATLCHGTRRPHRQASLRQKIFLHSRNPTFSPPQRGLFCVSRGWNWWRFTGFQNAFYTLNPAEVVIVSVAVLFREVWRVSPALIKTSTKNARRRKTIYRRQNTQHPSYVITESVIGGSYGSSLFRPHSERVGGFVGGKNTSTNKGKTQQIAHPRHDQPLRIWELVAWSHKCNPSNASKSRSETEKQGQTTGLTTFLYPVVCVSDRSTTYDDFFLP